MGLDGIRTFASAASDVAMFCLAALLLTMTALVCSVNAQVISSTTVTVTTVLCPSSSSATPSTSTLPGEFQQTSTSNTGVSSESSTSGSLSSVSSGIPTSSSTAAPKPVSTFVVAIDIPQGSKFRLTAWTPGKAAEVASRGDISGPAKISLTESDFYGMNIWSTRVEGVYLQQCHLPTDANIADQSFVFDSTGTRVAGPENRLYCEQAALDPASGPSITLDPRGVSIKFTKPALFGGDIFASMRQAVFRGVVVDVWDNVEFVIITDRFSYSCQIGTRGRQTQTKDVVFTIQQMAIPTDRDLDSIAHDWPAQENVGVKCARIKS